ncbi:hypothetical protein L1987_32455 [Smallanthus sonchifolius]|uniref:Uncharacterized protein n=1 Tax=Smallanthus sonchifolius TaxID=185202 RepID=A0ACB9HPM0_9ASTR|nr:hypothetical protein L1987_32455 [Smallanthus sonchifolius]
MHHFDLHLLSCLHHAKPGLPPEIREKIFALTFETRRKWRKKEQVPPCCGISKSAIKRRAKRYERCPNCGNWSHEGKCSKNQTESQHEYTELIKVGAIRLQAERSLRKDSYVYLRVKEEVKFLKTRFGLDNLTINESSIFDCLVSPSNRVLLEDKQGPSVGRCKVIKIEETSKNKEKNEEKHNSRNPARGRAQPSTPLCSNLAQGRAQPSTPPCSTHNQTKESEKDCLLFGRNTGPCPT